MAVRSLSPKPAALLPTYAVDIHFLSELCDKTLPLCG